jgi:hypothetical protein
MLGVAEKAAGGTTGRPATAVGRADDNCEVDEGVLGRLSCTTFARSIVGASQSAELIDENDGASELSDRRSDWASPTTGARIEWPAEAWPVVCERSLTEAPLAKTIGMTFVDCERNDRPSVDRAVWTERSSEKGSLRVIRSAAVLARPEAGSRLIDEAV